MLVFNYLNLLTRNIPCLAPIQSKAPLIQFYGPTVQEMGRFWKVRRNLGNDKYRPFPSRRSSGIGEGFCFKWVQYFTEY